MRGVAAVQGRMIREHVAAPFWRTVKNPGWSWNGAPGRAGYCRFCKHKTGTVTMGLNIGPSGPFGRAEGYVHWDPQHRTAADAALGVPAR